jgi:hypothetical protein
MPYHAAAPWSSSFQKLEIEHGYGYAPVMLKPQDIVVLLALVGRPRDAWDFPSLSAELGMSLSAIHRALSRLADAGLYSAGRGAVRSANALEFLVHAAKYLIPISEGPIARGVPTGSAASPLKDQLEGPDNNAIDAVWVWPHPSGNSRGISIEPLTPNVPDIAMRHPTLYRRLAALDALRGGRARERHLAEAWFREELELA